MTEDRLDEVERKLDLLIRSLYGVPGSAWPIPKKKKVKPNGRRKFIRAERRASMAISARRQLGVE